MQQAVDPTVMYRVQGRLQNELHSRGPLVAQETVFLPQAGHPSFLLPSKEQKAAWGWSWWTLVK